MDRELNEEEKKAFKVGTVVLSTLGALVLVLALFFGIRIGGKNSKSANPNAVNNGQVAGEEQAVQPTTPTETAQPTVAPATSSSANKETTSGQYIEYTVKSGDTLYDIATKYKVTWQEIAALNDISNQNALKVGMKLKIPKK